MCSAVLMQPSRVRRNFTVRPKARGRLQEAGLRHVFKKFLADESAATAIEYALIAAGIALAIITAVNGLGSTLNTSYSSINSSLK